ncbi:unnamed protein product, partial [marine sediment metagenome]
NTLKKIRFIPTFRTDSEYSEDNPQGISRDQTLLWDSKLVSFMDDGQEYMHVELEHDLKTDLVELAYIFNERLQYLSFPEGVSLSYTLENYTSTMSAHILHVPRMYLHPDTNETTRFKEGQTFVIRYNSPVKRG